MPTSTLTTQHYRLLGLCALTLTLFMLLVPGTVIQATLTLASQILPWSTSDLPSDAGFPIDKIIHFSLFCLTGLLLAKGWSREQPGGSTVLLLSLVMLGVITEGLQYYIPGRFASVGDVIANTAGALVGVLWGLYPAREKQLQ